MKSIDERRLAEVAGGKPVAGVQIETSGNGDGQDEDKKVGDDPGGDSILH
jgi:hypothetical protein